MGISTHVLDTSTGRPAVGVGVVLTRVIGGLEAGLLNRAATDADGRCRFLLPLAEPMPPGVYAVRFDTGAYFAEQGVEGLYPHVDITFVVEAGQTHYHIPLLLTANGYTTYRGS